MKRGGLAKTAFVGALGVGLGFALAYGLKEARPGDSKAGLNPPIDAPRPIASPNEHWIERMTWMEVRDAIKRGSTTAIIPTGGVEQNGPYVVTGKHNVILTATADAIATRLGNALIAPIIPFVPQGDINPPTRHMRYPGTISVQKPTFAALVSDVAASLRTHGFKEIVLIGDSGSNQKVLAEVAEELNEKWNGKGAEVRFVEEYYDWPGRQEWLAAQGYRETEQGFHDELSVNLIMLSVDPESVRMRERVAAGKFSINGVSLAPADRSARIGRTLVDHIAKVTVAALAEQRANDRD